MKTVLWLILPIAMFFYGCAEDVSTRDPIPEKSSPDPRTSGEPTPDVSKDDNLETEQEDTRTNESEFPAEQPFG